MYNKNYKFQILLKDVQKELQYYKKHFDNKIILCFDCPEKGALFQYFSKLFSHLKLKKLVTVYINNDNDTFKTIIDSKGNQETVKIINNNLRDPSNKKLLEEADIVCSSLKVNSKEVFLKILLKNKKSFLLSGSKKIINTKIVFREICERESIWIGVNEILHRLNTKNNKVETIKEGAHFWFTNLSHNVKKRHLDLLVETYDPKMHPKYDQSDIVHVENTEEIPNDYYEKMSVPMFGFIKDWSPNEFDIIERVVKGSNLYLKGQLKKRRLIVQRTQDKNQKEQPKRTRLIIQKTQDVNHKTNWNYKCFQNRDLLLEFLNSKKIKRWLIEKTEIDNFCIYYSIENEKG